MPITCSHRQLKVLREHTARRQTARATLAVPPRQARQVAYSSSNGLSGSGVSAQYRAYVPLRRISKCRPSRSRIGSALVTPRNRGNSSAHACLYWKSLCSRRLSGGERSLGATDLWGISVRQGKYREIHRGGARSVELKPRFTSPSKLLTTNSL
jgi:hypothetical protein